MFSFSIPIPAIPLELPKEIQKIYTEYNMENQNNNKNQIKNKSLYQKEVQSGFGLTGIEFDEMKFDSKNEINIIINNMKNSIKSQFLYKKEKNNLIGLENVNDFIKEIEENEIIFGIESLQRLIDLSIPITNKGNFFSKFTKRNQIL